MKKILIIILVVFSSFFTGLVINSYAANDIPRLWERINYLVPEPQCRTFGNDYDRIIWTDARTMPTAGEVWSVKDKDIDDAQADKAKDAKLSDDTTNALIEVIADLHSLTVSDMKQLVKDKLK